MDRHELKPDVDQLVTIICDLKGDDSKVVVTPGCLVLKKGDGVKFRSSRTASTVFIPKLEFYFADDKAQETVRLIDVPRNGTSKTLKLKQNARIKSGVEHPYAIYCEKYDEFAEVNSPPTMIIIEDD
jgi:hypothetical protein